MSIPTIPARWICCPDWANRIKTRSLGVSAKPPPWECVGFEGGFGPKGLGNLAQEPVGFEGDFGPKGLGNSAQALAWVPLFLRASPVRAPDNAGAIPIDRTQIQMTTASAPSGLVAFIVTLPRLKPGLSSQGPSGRNRLQIREAPGQSSGSPSG
jgi:hypothetical protein